MQIADYYGYKSVNDFALNGLEYTHSEKINRLKGENAKPSFDILKDISNKFEKVNLNWLINDVGNMLYDETKSKKNVVNLNDHTIDHKIDHKPEVKKLWSFPEKEKGERMLPVPLGSGLGVPLIPIDAMAGYGQGDTTVLDYETSRYMVPEFEELHVDFMISVKGSSMYPKYNSGDIVACKKLVLNDIFFQWNKVYVLDTTQGALIKRIKKGSDKDHILLVSDNLSYDPFEIHLNKIRAISLVIGVIRLE